MKKQHLAFITLFFLMNFQILSSQSKIENYYNVNFEKITKEEFEKISKQKGYRYNQFDLEDQIANILYQPKTRGRLTSQELSNVRNQLNKINYLKNGYIIIVYYPGKDRCNGMERNSTWNIFDRDYQKEVNKLVENNQFWIFKNDENLKYYYPKKINWKKDENQFFEKLFFKMHYPCFSSTIIDERGNYISNLGEFGKQSIIADIKELKR